MALKDSAGYPRPAHRLMSIASQASSTSKLPRSGISGPAAMKDGSDEQRNCSKFLEAMKNPNWRDRRKDGASSSSNSTELTGPETTILNKNMTRARHLLASTSADAAKIEPDNIGNRKISAPDRQFDVRHMIDGAACHDGCIVAREKPGGAIETKGLCDVMRRLDINAPRSHGNGVHIIEVTPHIATARDSVGDSTGSPRYSPVVAEIQLIQVLPAETQGHGLSQGHDYELEPKLCLHKSQVEQLNPSRETDHSTESSTRATTSEETGAALVPAAVPDLIQLQPAQQVPTAHDATSAAGEGHKGSSLNAKNIAFQRMLKKLKIRTAGSRPSEDRESAGGTSSVFDPAVEESFGSARADKSLVTGMKLFVRRDKTASDHAVSYRPGTSSHQAERSKDSGYSSDKLNPKAREFLSFNPEDYEDTETRERRGLLASPNGSFNYGSGSLTDMWAGPDFEARHQVESYEPVQYSYGIPQQYPDVRCLMPIQAGFGLDVLGSAVNSVTCPPHMGALARQPSLTPAWLSSGNLLPRPSMSDSSPYPIISSAFQSLPSRFYPPAPGVPAHPLTASAPQVSAFGRPAPVPKPKVPNAWDQQAYEAYIEQRKAMEPGYAMECKLRQQRRIKRTTDTRQSPRQIHLTSSP